MKLSIQLFNLFCKHIFSLLILLNIPLKILHLTLIVHINLIISSLNLLHESFARDQIIFQLLILTSQLHIDISKILIVEHELIYSFSIENSLIGKLL